MKDLNSSSKKLSLNLRLTNQRSNASNTYSNDRYRQLSSSTRDQVGRTAFETSEIGRTKLHKGMSRDDFDCTLFILKDNGRFDFFSLKEQR